MAKKIIHTSGKRKSSIARATARIGVGKVKVNSVSLEVVTPEIARLRIQEPLIIAGEHAQKFDIDVNVSGGGVMSSADAARLAIAKVLVQAAGKTSKLRETFLAYDRQLLVADVRHKETCKPNISRARAKRQKSYR
jgi:small subunit ribosomal protein S9